MTTQFGIVFTKMALTVEWHYRETGTSAMKKSENPTCTE
jgi:hypothetical protein